MCLTLKKYEKRKTHNMILLMLDTQFKNLLLVSPLVNCEQSISIIEEHDRKSLHPIFLNCYHHWHSMTNCEIGFTD